MFAFEAKQPPQPYFALGNGVVDIVGGTLFLDDGPAVRLEPKTIHVLAVLAANANQVIRRGDLLDAVWGSMPIGDEVLSRHASLLRKVLLGVLRAPEGIETVRKSGYRLNANIVWMESYSPSYAQSIDQLEALELPPLATHALERPDDNSVPDAPARLMVETDEPSPDLRGTSALRPSAPLGGAWIEPGVELVAEVVEVKPRRAPAVTKALAWTAAMTATIAVAAWFLLESPSRMARSESTRQVAGLDKATRLNANTALDVFPDVAPGGGVIAFVRLSDDGSRSAIVLQSLGDAGEHELIAAEAKHYYPRFSPDGGYLGYARVQGDDCSFLRVPVSGGAPRRMAACPDSTPVAFDWGPDADVLLVATSGKGIVSRLAEINLETGKTSFVQGPGGRAIAGRDPRYGSSRDEVFFLGAEGRPRLMRLRRAAGLVEPVVRGSGDYESFAYVEGARMLVAIVQRDGEALTEVIDAENGLVNATAAAPGIFPSASRTPQGQVVVAYMRYATDSKLFEIQVPAASSNAPHLPLAMRALFATQADDTDPVYSRDGGLVYFASNRSGAYELWTGDLRTGATIQLTRLDADYLEFLSRSHDGRQLLLTRQKNGRYGLLKVDVSSPDRVRVQAFAEKSVVQAMASRFSPDGRWAYFAGKSSDTSGWRAFRAELSIDPLAEHPKPISPEGLAQAYPLSPEDVILGRTGRNGLWHYAPAEDKIEELLPGWQSAEAAVHAQQLYYFERPYKTGAAGTRLCRLTKSTANAPVCLGALDPAPFTVTGFDLREDQEGLRVVMSTVPRIEGDIWYSKLEMGSAASPPNADVLQNSSSKAAQR